MRSLSHVWRWTSRPVFELSLAAIAVATATSFATIHPAEAKGERPSAKKEAAKKETAKIERPKGPFVVVVSTRKQRLTVWGPSGKVTESPVSTGQPGHETPHGVFSIIGKEQMHFSNLYNSAPMPWMQRITWSGVAMHAGNLPGYPASHGCIRLPYNFSKALFGITPMDTRVIVAHDEPVPVAFADPLLLTPLPPASDQPDAPSGPVASAAGLVEPARLGGPAAADVTPDGRPVTSPLAEAKPRRTREQIAIERTARISSLMSEVRIAEIRKNEAAPAAQTAAQAVQEVRKLLRSAMATADKLTQTEKSVSRKVADLTAKLSALVKTHAKLTSDEAIDRAADLEQALEKKLSDLSPELEKAKADVAEQAAKVAELARKAAEAEKARVEAVANVKATAETLRAKKTALDQAKREEANSSKPITVLISRKTGKLHIRQAGEDLFDTPIVIQDSQFPLGTHVLTALEFTNGERDLRWNLLTVKSSQAVDEAAPRRSKRSKKEEIAVTLPVTEAPPQTAAKALERIKIPESAQEKISEFIKPGSSILITDQGISHETTKGTDYVILTH